MTYIPTPPKQQHQKPSSSMLVIVNIATQTLRLYKRHTLDEMACRDKKQSVCASPIDNYTLVREFQVSTAKNGIGSQENTGCTPLGRHIIADKIGEGAAINTVFVAREATGEIYSAKLQADNPDRDWILTRILWLQGLEEGVNLGCNAQGCCDTYQRYIYIHGTPDTEPVGIPLSHGCIRMRNTDIVWLFEQVATGTIVEIVAE